MWATKYSRQFAIGILDIFFLMYGNSLRRFPIYITHFIVNISHRVISGDGNMYPALLPAATHI